MLSGRERRFLETILTWPQLSVMAITPAGEIVFWSPGAEELFGYNRSEAEGRSLVDLIVPPQRVQEIRKAIAEALQVGHTTFESVRSKKDGTLVPVEIAMKSVPDGEGGPFIVATQRDITYRTRIRDELEAVSRRRSEDLQRFAFSVQRAHEEERQRIARELHDDLGSRLTGMKLKIEILQEDLPANAAALSAGLEQVKKGIEGLVGEIRRISSNLRPPVLDDFGLVAAVRLLCKEFEGSSKIAVRFRGDPVRGGNKDAEIGLYRIAQEALTNVAHHARARSVGVRLSQHDEWIRLVVEDDGKGLAKRNGNGRRMGLGLIGMNERAQMLGGSVKITSSPGRGTRVEAEIPASAGEGEQWRKSGY